MKRNVRHYISALVVLTACALTYHHLAAAVLQPPEVEIVSPRPPTAQPTLNASLADLFPEGAWQLGNCKRVLTRNGALLFKTWHQTSDDYWRLEPITLVVGRGLSEDGSDAPVVLTAPEGAEVEFAEPFDAVRGTAPPIRMGRMIGDVYIQRAQSRKGRGALRAQTRNVYIDNQRVWSTENISMQVDDAVISGRDLTIFLAAAATTAARAESTASILDRMELVYLEKMQIPIAVDSKNSTRRNPHSANLDNEKQFVDVRCDGKLSYDFALDQLTLRKNVVISRQIGPTANDLFRCHALDLVLRDPENKTIDRNGPLDWIERARAVGQPAILQAASYDLSLQADSIDFNAAAGTVDRRRTARRSNPAGCDRSRTGEPRLSIRP